MDEFTRVIRKEKTSYSYLEICFLRFPLYPSSLVEYFYICDVSLSCVPSIIHIPNFPLRFLSWRYVVFAKICEEHRLVSLALNLSSKIPFITFLHSWVLCCWCRLDLCAFHPPHSHPSLKMLKLKILSICKNLWSA